MTKRAGLATRLTASYLAILALGAVDVPGDDGARDGEHDGEDRRDPQGEPPPDSAEHHARRTNPTPRTVWSTRGSPPTSSLRRR